MEKTILLYDPYPTSPNPNRKAHIQKFLTCANLKFEYIFTGAENDCLPREEGHFRPKTIGFHIGEGCD